MELDGDFYIVRNDNSAVACRTSKLPRLGSMSNTYHLTDVTYWENSVFVSFHHALCDGRGIKPFIETLIYYYCQMRYQSTADANGIRLAEDSLLEGETVDPFYAPYEYDQSKQFPEVSRDGYSIPENHEQSAESSYRYELVLDQEAYMAACKANGATPAILTALLMNAGIAALYPDYDKPIHANIATDMREALGAPNTFKNCVKSITLPYSHELAQMTLPEQSVQYREMMKAQRDADYCRKEANAMLGMFDRLDNRPSFEEKQKIMSYFDRMVLNTYVISYIGQFILNENESYIDALHLYNSGVVGLGINMVCCSGKFILDFKQSFPSDKYVKAFAEQLSKLGVSYELSPRIEFSTPTDALMKRTEEGKV